MPEPSDPRPDGEAETRGPAAPGGSSMESIETTYGQPIDPGIELDNADPSETETVAGATPNHGASTSRAPTASAASTGRHTVRGEIARGGMGAIFEVRDTDLRRSLAMKVILGSSSGSGASAGSAPTVPPELIKRFLEGAQVEVLLGVLQRQTDYIRDDEAKLAPIRETPEFKQLMDDQQEWIDERTK